MNYRNAFFLLLMTTIIMSCNNDNDDTNNYQETETTVKTLSLPDTVATNENLAMELTVFGLSGCSEYSRYETTVVGDTTKFTVYQRRPEATNCTTNIIEIDTVINLSFATAKKHYVEFKSMQNTPIIDSILVTE